ncbi:PAS domain S-box protein [Synechococcus sp. AH-551-G15]|nr:PAS domain S-box protein [Synechococcus sp. AH-551-G15]
MPFVLTDEQGQVVEFNDRFRLIYGWDDGLVGQTIGMILPASFRELHHAGFSRFKLTETSKLVNHPLELATICSDGAEIRSEHFIVAERSDAGGWSFAATLRPLEGPHAC